MPDKQSATITLYKFFNFKNAAEMKEGCKGLSNPEKEELATLAANEMGLPAEQRDWPKASTNA